MATLLGAGVLGSAAVLGANVWAARASAGHAYAAELAPQRPVALVLGAGLTPAGTPTPYLAYRLDVAKQLYDAGTVRVLLVSGDNRTHAYDEPTAMTDYLVAHGIPAERIVQDFAGRDTYDSCARARRIFGVEQLIVVTQSTTCHGPSRRAGRWGSTRSGSGTCRAGASPTCGPADRNAKSLPWSRPCGI